jgi:hypothetical protein
MATSGLLLKFGVETDLGFSVAEMIPHRELVVG